MQREYKAIVDAGFILQLDCPDLAMLRHMVYLDLTARRVPQDHHRQRRRAQPRGRDMPAERMRMHVCWGSTMAPHHTDVALKDIVDIVLDRQAAGGVVPRRQRAPRARVENLARRQAARRQDHHPGRDRFHRRTRWSTPKWWPIVS